MAQPIYYSDGEVQVSGESAVFNNSEHSLAGVTRASLERKQLQPWQGQPGQLDRGTILGLLALLWFIIRLLLRAVPNPIIGIGVAVFFGVVARQVNNQLKEKEKQQYAYVIELHEPSGSVEVFTSADASYARTIVHAINQAIEKPMTEGRRKASEGERRRRRHRGAGGRSSPGSRYRKGIALRRKASKS